MRLKLPVSVIIMLLLLAAANADPAREELLRATITALFPDVEITRISESPAPGLYEVALGAEVLYLSADGRYLLQGDLLDLNSRVNVTEQQRAAARKVLLSAVPEQEMISFAPATAAHTVYVFTDITCGYCRQFHQDVPQLNDRGVLVKYLAFPRAGYDSAAFTDMESVWCAADRNVAMTTAKQGQPVTAAQCDNPVASQYELGGSMGVRGTPAIYLEDGQAMPGYVPPDVLLQALEEARASS